MTGLSGQLKEMLLETEIVLSEQQQSKCLHYLSLLEKWNQVYNLTAIRDIKAMLIKHLLDSLVLLPEIDSGRFLDVGTGAGLPGIPIAIAIPELTCVLLDSNQKKIHFIDHVVRSLMLHNVSPFRERVEKLNYLQGFDWVVSRAFASLEKFVLQAGHLCLPTGKMIAMKGDESVAPFTQIGAFTVSHVKPIIVPGLLAKRCLVFLSHTDNHQEDL